MARALLRPVDLTTQSRGPINVITPVLRMGCTVPSGAEAARIAAATGLYFSADCMPGIRRVSGRHGFEYRRDGGGLATAEEADRIARLAIPPAWTDVWICADGRGHLQATGRDARGRKQYRYHPEWVKRRSEDKFGRMAEFGHALSRIRGRVRADLRTEMSGRTAVLALAVLLLDETSVRIGSPRYRELHQSYGLTTLTSQHLSVDGREVQLQFRGKAGRDVELSLTDARIARAMCRLSELPGQDLFRYADERGRMHVIGSGDVNAYLREAAGSAVTSKDFRTWGGTLAATEVLIASDAPPSDRVITSAYRAASQVLHNTPAVCRTSYVHPGVVSLYRSGELAAMWDVAAAGAGTLPLLSAPERTLLTLIETLAGTDFGTGVRP